MTMQLQHPGMMPQQPQQQPGQAGGQTPFPPELANFNLIPLTNRNSERSPHYFGSFKLGGKWFQVSSWIRYAANTGIQMLSNSIRECTPEEAARHEAREAQFRANAPQNTMANTLNPLSQQAQVQQAPAQQPQQIQMVWDADPAANPPVDNSAPF